MGSHHKVRKFFGVLLGVLIALILVLLCIVLFWLGPTVKMVAQHVGTKALGAPLTIKELKINPRHGTVHMTGFAIANPAGFGRTNAVSLASLDISVDMASIFSSTVLVHQVEIDSPHFVYEQSKDTDNITQFGKNIAAFSGPKSTEPPKKKPKEEEKGSKIVVVEKLEINDVRLDLAHTDDTNLDVNAGFKQLAVSMTNGTVQLKHMYVSNPRRLQTPNLFSLDGISIQIDPASIYSGPLSIRDIQVTRPYAYLEQNRQTDTVAEFMKIASRFSKKSDSLAAAPPAETNAVTTNIKTETGTTNPPPVLLQRLAVDDIQLKLLDSTQTNAPTDPQMLAGIGSISAHLEKGKVRIQNIRVANPQGYVATNLFHLADIDVSLDPKSLFSAQTIIQKILVNSPEINLEQTKTRGNIAALQETLMGFAPPAPANAGAPTPAHSPVAGEPSKPIPLDQQPVVLKDLVITNFAVNLTLPSTTNAPVKWALDVSDIQKLNPVDKLSLAKLHLFGTAPTATNATEKTEETVGPGPLKLVAFRQLSVRPLDGELQLDDLSIANPHNFAYRDLAKLKKLKVELDPDTLQSPTLIIKDILIDAPDIAYERQLTTDNIEALQTELEKVLSKQETSEEQKSEVESPEPKQQEEAGQKVIIKHLQIQGGTVRPKLSVLPAPPIPLSLELFNVGEKTGGTSISGMLADLGGNIYDFIIGTVASATGFAGNTLKGAGALSLDALGFITGGATDNLGQSFQKEQQAEPNTTATEIMTKPKEKKQTRTKMPGRTF